MIIKYTSSLNVSKVIIIKDTLVHLNSQCVNSNSSIIISCMGESRGRKLNAHVYRYECVGERINWHVRCVCGWVGVYGEGVSKISSQAHTNAPLGLNDPNKAKKKKLLYWRKPKIRPDPTFFFLNQKKRQKNDRPILKKAKPVIFMFKHLILALKMLIWGFETWLVA